MSHARETTLFVDFFKNPSIMPLGVFLVFNVESYHYYQVYLDSTIIHIKFYQFCLTVF